MSRRSAVVARLTLAEVRRRQVVLLLDIEHGLCSIPCAGASHHAKCNCVCKGENHGALWIIDTLD